MVDIKKLQERFFTDPQWAEMEELIMGYITPLVNMSSIDTKQPSENVKAEIIARQIAHDTLLRFLTDTRVLTRGREQGPVTNPFK